MKKFISMVMAAAMVVSLVPATAFAANAATFKVVNDQEYTEAQAEDVKKGNKKGAGQKEATITGPEIQLKLKDVDSKKDAPDDFEITLDFNNAELAKSFTAKVINDENVATNPNDDVVGSGVGAAGNVKVYVKEDAAKGDDSVKLIVLEPDSYDLEDDDVIVIDLEDLGLVLTKASKNTKATVEVGGDFGDSDALTFASVLDTGIKVSLKKVAEVAEEETTKLEKELKIETTVGTFVQGQVLELKLNSGFEWTGVEAAGTEGTAETIANGALEVKEVDDNVLTTVVTAAGDGEGAITIAKDDVKIDAADAKVGAVAKITVKAKTFKDSDGKVKGFSATAAAVEAAKVVGDTVTLSVDEDEDLPVIYSGVDVDNNGITDDSDHKSLEITLKESVKEAFDSKKAFTMTLPEGVYVTKVEEVDNDDNALVATSGTVVDAFKAAYEKGEYEKFDFKRRTFKDSAKAIEYKFQFELVAEPDFEGDVTLKLAGDAFDKDQEVKIAKFVKPYTVEASQNDLIIDYRNTKVPTNIVVKEAEAGLWDKDLEFTFAIDRFSDGAFENDATYTVDDKSDLEVKAAKKGLGFKVDEESDDVAATVTISDISLYMDRSIAAGAYDLELLTNANVNMYLEELATNEDTALDNNKYEAFKDVTVDASTVYTVADAADYVNNKNNLDIDYATVKEGFVNVITAGRDKDDASFTTKVVVPVGEMYIVAGEQTVALDVPAYVSASGYTMLPVRAVAVALGILNNNVLWDQTTKTVTILYGQRIITMTVGAKVINVNGSAIPASSSPEVVNGRTFLPMRDLATALGVTDITWDAATKTATLNGNK